MITPTTSHAGRELRNRQIHATTLAVFNSAITAKVIATSHKLVADVFREWAATCRPAACPKSADQRSTDSSEQLRGNVNHRPMAHLSTTTMGQPRPSSVTVQVRAAASRS